MRDLGTQLGHGTMRGFDVTKTTSPNLLHRHAEYAVRGVTRIESRYISKPFSKMRSIDAPPGTRVATS